MASAAAQTSLKDLFHTLDITVVSAKVARWEADPEQREYRYTARKRARGRCTYPLRLVAEADLSASDRSLLRFLGAAAVAAADVDWCNELLASERSGGDGLRYASPVRSSSPTDTPPGIPLGAEPLAVGDEVWALAADEQSKLQPAWKMADVEHVGNGSATLKWRGSFLLAPSKQRITVSQGSAGVRFTADRRAALPVFAVSDSEDEVEVEVEVEVEGEMSEGAMSEDEAPPPPPLGMAGSACVDD